MKIGVTIQTSNTVVAYSDHGTFLFRKVGQLVGFTPDVVTVSQNGGRTLVMFDASGLHRATLPPVGAM